MDDISAEKFQQLADENKLLKQANLKLNEQVNSLLAQLTPATRFNKPVVESPVVDGTLRPETLTIESCVCFYEQTGQNSGLIVHDGLARKGKIVDWIAYSDANFSYHDAETKLAKCKSVVLIFSKDSLIHPSAVVIVQVCSAYNIPIICVHDLTSCAFPNPSHQPQQIQDSGIFHDKAITYVKDYFDAVLEQILQQAQTAMKTRNFCLCAPKAGFDLSPVMNVLQTTKYFQLAIEPDDVDESRYYNKIKHTITSCKSLIYVLDPQQPLTKFLAATIKLAVDSNIRIYFVSQDPNISVTKLIGSEIAPWKISGVSWDGASVVTQVSSNNNIQVEAPVRFSNMIFKTPVSSGKWYYEVIPETSGIFQIGWSNQFIDLSQEGNGIGDDRHSYAYDGSRSTLYPKKSYGKPWKSGDVIGCLIDLDSQEISYSQNGEHLGVGFSGFREKDANGEWVPYFPSLSIGTKQKWVINLGSSPFKHCPEEYRGVIETSPIRCVTMESIQEIFEIESKYGNYNMTIPRTRAFLSHKRSSAQGVAGRIWQELKNKYNIFLDSEAQFDLHDLKIISKYTGLFIVILSEGIFDSYWCLEELRSAIRHNRKILVLQDFQFKVPAPFPIELADIEQFYYNCDKVLYMAEFFSECIKQIESRLGPSDMELAEKLKYLSDGTKKSVLNNSFDVDGSFVILEGLNTSVADYIKLIKEHFECSSLTEITLFESRVTVTDADMDCVTMIASKLKSIVLPGVPGKGITDTTAKYLSERCSKIQVIRFRGNCKDLTDETFKCISQLPELTRLTVWGATSITDQALFYLSNLTKLEELVLSEDIQITDVGIGHLKNLMYLTSQSKNYTDNGIEQLVKQNPELQKLDLKFANLNDESIDHILKWGKNIQIVDFSSSIFSGECLRHAPLPPSLTKLIARRGSQISAPKGSACQILLASL